MGVAAAVGFDVGGTNWRASTVSSDGEVLETRTGPAPVGDADALIEAVSAAIKDLGAEGLPVGLGVACLVRDRSYSLFGPNLMINHTDLGGALRERGIEYVVVGNDATLATYGEWQVGAAKGHDDVVMLTLGTGVGGGLVLGGRLVEGANGFGGELGHVLVDHGGRKCPCGRSGCLEAYASGQALSDEAHERLSREGEAALVPSILEPEDLDPAAISAAARKGDPFARDVVEQVGQWLGRGLTSMVNAFDPSIIVIGGGVGEAVGELMLDEARAVVAQDIEGAEHRDAPPIVQAALADRAGQVGAALLALHAREGRA